MAIIDDKDLVSRYRFFHEHAGWAEPPGKVACALALARAEREAENLGITFEWEDEIDPWDGEGPAPKYLLTCFAKGPDGEALDNLGMVAVNSMLDPYLRVVQAEVASRAIDELKPRGVYGARCDEREGVCHAS